MDIVLLAVILLSVFLAARKGFFLSLLEVVAGVAAVVAAYVVRMPLAQLVYEELAREPILNKVQALLPADLTNGDPQALLDGLLAQLPKGVVSIAETYGIIPEELAFIDNAAAFFRIENLESLYIRPFCLTVLELVATIVVFYLMFVVLRFVAKLIDNAVHKDKPQKINRLAGGLLGAAKAAIPVAVFAVLLNFAADYKLNDTLTAAVENSRICAFVNDAVMSVAAEDSVHTTISE